MACVDWDLGIFPLLFVCLFVYKHHRKKGRVKIKLHGEAQFTFFVQNVKWFTETS